MHKLRQYFITFRASIFDIMDCGMANTYTTLFVHLISAVKFRQHLIPVDHRDESEKYIRGISRNKKSKPIAFIDAAKSPNSYSYGYRDFAPPEIFESLACFCYRDFGPLGPTEISARWASYLTYPDFQ